MQGMVSKGLLLHHITILCLLKFRHGVCHSGKLHAKMDRNLQEFRIRGIKTNIPFLENVVKHENFLVGDYDTSFIDSTPELFDVPDQERPWNENFKLYRKCDSQWISWDRETIRNHFFIPVRKPNVDFLCTSASWNKQILG